MHVDQTKTELVDLFSSANVNPNFLRAWIILSAVGIEKNYYREKISNESVYVDDTHPNKQ